MGKSGDRKLQVRAAQVMRRSRFADLMANHTDFAALSPERQATKTVRDDHDETVR